ncbi:Endothelin-converting enzyme 1 [Operophtera brumata]|uniref:Endothelin-converting enzyme 1 n=1 Tax=Operophtera brumata TaxID=104452 RepID=A0A0L7L462_OPEBR|nr:Endothelin-converting enzyme 1 [Operophtera brumata]
MTEIIIHKGCHKLMENSRLAKITSAPEDRRNVSELYRRMTLVELEELVPEVKWRRYLCIVMNRSVHSNETVVLFALSYVRNLPSLLLSHSHISPSHLAALRLGLPSELISLASCFLQRTVVVPTRSRYSYHYS